MSKTLKSDTLSRRFLIHSLSVSALSPIFSPSHIPTDCVYRVMAQETPEVEFVLIHPGWVATDMGSSGGRSADITSETSAAGIVAIATEEQKRTAVFLDYMGNTLPW